MADSAEFVLKLKDLFSGPAKKAARTSKKTGEEALKAAGLFKDAAGKWRHANGKFATSTQLAAAGIKKQKKASEGMTGSIKKLAKAYIVLKAAQLGAAAGMAVFQRSMKTNRLEAMFDTLEHGKGKESFAEVSNLAMQFGLDIDSTAKQYGKFLKLQFKPEAAKNMLKLGADMQALGNTAEEVDGIFTAMGQIKSKGKLQAEEMMQLAERGVSGMLIKKHVAKLMGVAQSEVEGLQRKGMVSGDIGLQAIEGALNEKLKQKQAGESGKKFAQNTMAGATAVAKQRANLMWIELNKGAEGGLATGMTGAMEAFNKFAQSDNGQKTLGMIQSLFKGIGDTMAIVMPLVVELGGALIGGLMEGFNAFGEAMGFSVAEGGDWADLFRSMIPAITTAGKAMGFVAGIFVNGIKVIGLALTGVAMGISGLVELGEMAFNWGKDLLDGFIRGIADGVYKLKETVGGIVDTVTGAFTGKEGFDMHSPSRVTRQWGNHLGDGLAIGMEESMPDVGPNVNGGTRTVATAASKMSAGMSGGSVSVGNVTIQVEGSADPEQTAQATLRAFDRNLGAVLSRYAGEAGAPA